MSQQLTPPALRGHFYPSALIRRCPNFHYCRRCHMCANYNVHDATCNLCEDRKFPKRVCTCTQAQRVMLIQIENKAGRPVYDRNIDAEGGPQVMFETNHNQTNQELVDGLMQANQENAGG